MVWYSKQFIFAGLILLACAHEAQTISDVDLVVVAVSHDNTGMISSFIVRRKRLRLMTSVR